MGIMSSKKLNKAQEEALSVLCEINDWVEGCRGKTSLTIPSVNNNAAKILYERKIIQRRGSPSTGIKKTKLEYRV